MSDAPEAVRQRRLEAGRSHFETARSEYEARTYMRVLQSQLRNVREVLGGIRSGELVVRRPMGRRATVKQRTHRELLTETGIRDATAETFDVIVQEINDRLHPPAA